MDASFVIFFEERIGGNLKRRKLKLEFRQWPNGSEKCVWNLNNDFDGENDEGNLHFAYFLEQNADFVEYLLDLPIFVLKALTLLNSKSTLSDALNFIPISIQFSGPLQLQLTSIRQKNFAHKEIFLRVAEWLLKNQDDRGGWPIPVERIFNKDEEENKLFLSAGWYSAMAQGHALSFLARAFNATGDERFLLAGERACDLFELPTSKGGIKNQLFGYDWYEEYPTLPSGTFVLNGFIYALVGLNDFSSFYNENKNSSNFSSKKLFFNGINSLRSLLPLFDTGQRSLYDLRHVQLKGNLRPNIARWDYHSLHVTLLDWLYFITQENFFKEISKRWVDYSNGLKIKHN
uniref:Heparosan-N-sulfate-glucuronate 5-epimerase n=1 Tax=Meloidogyne incognita TaxID=6306 RepID=A0A914LDX0_MELIC